MIDRAPRRSRDGGGIDSAPSPSASNAVQATLIVRQTFSESGFYTEGAYAYVELFDSTGRLVHRWDTMDYHLDLELARVMVDPGRYDVRSYVRPCEAACPALDGPLAGCSAVVEIAAGETVTVSIHRRLRTCEAVRA